MFITQLFSWELWIIIYDLIIMSLRNPISKADCPEGEDEGDLEECKTVEKNQTDVVLP